MEVRGKRDARWGFPGNAAESRSPGVPAQGNRGNWGTHGHARAALYTREVAGSIPARARHAIAASRLAAAHPRIAAFAAEGYIAG